MNNIVRLHASSGTTGKPTVVGYTKRDIETWAELMARSFAAAGLTKNDIIHNAYGYGLFTGGLGAHYGAERLGASVIPMSGGNTKKQIMITAGLRPHGHMLHAVVPPVPCRDRAKRWASTCSRCGSGWASLAPSPGASACAPRSRAGSTSRRSTSTAFPRSWVPGVAMECIEGRNGLHIFEDHFIAEVIDPENRRGPSLWRAGRAGSPPLPRRPSRSSGTGPGTSRLMPEACRCGRTLVRMERVSGRSDDMFIIRGVNVFPSQIESVIMEVKV